MISIDHKLDELLRRTLSEDIGNRDLTSNLISSEKNIKADVVFKEEGVLCGIDVAERIFRLIDENIRFLPVARDGERIDVGRAIFYVEGNARSILAAERSVLNFIAHLSGVATLTRKFVDEVAHTKSKIYDTRKTIPLMRSLQKYAVLVGGGNNHRFGLYDGLLVKDNHYKILNNMTVKDIANSARKSCSKKIKIGVEIADLSELDDALTSDCDYILLDNFGIKDLSAAVCRRNQCKSNIMLEASGGISLENIKLVAETGVDRISIGRLTHSVASIDVSMNLI